MPTLANVAIGPAILFGGLGLGLALLLPVVAIEALILWLRKWGSPRLALLDALLANLLSTAAGLLFFALFFTTMYGCERLQSADGTQVVDNCGFTISPLLALGVMGLLSIVIEGAVLQWRRAYPPRITWDAVIAANGISYALLLALGVLGILSL